MTDDSAKPNDFSQRPNEVASATRSVRFLHRTDWLTSALTTVLALTVYLVTLAPDVTLRFSGILSVGAMYAGVPHPPGYPLWTLYAWLFTELLPFSNIAWRAAVASAVAGALASGLIALMVSRGGAAMVEDVPGLKKLEPREQNALRMVCGFAAGMVFGLNGAFWGRAVVADVWTLSVLLFCFVLCLILRWSYEPSRNRYLYGASFVYGLTLTNSQLLLAAAPAIPFLVMVGNRQLGRDMFMVGSILFLAGLVGTPLGYLPSLTDPGGGVNSLFFIYVLIGLTTTAMTVALASKSHRLFTEWKTLLICGALFLLGLSFYLYPAIASMTNPPVNWGYPRTVPGLFHVLSRGQYERLQATDNPAVFLEQIRMYFAVTGKEFGWPYLLAALVPFGFLHRMSRLARGWMVGLLAVYLCLVFLLLAVLNPRGDQQSLELIKAFFSASYVVAGLWMGWGLIFLGILLARQPEPPPA